MFLSLRYWLLMDLWKILKNGSTPPPVITQGGGVQTMIVYSKMFTLVKAAFFRGNSMIQLNYKKQTKQD